MGRLNNIPKHKKPSLLTSLGNKAKTAVELAGTAKGLYDIGRGIYYGARALGPMLGRAAATIGPVVGAALL